MLHTHVSSASLLDLFAEVALHPSVAATVDLSFKYWDNLPRFYAFLEYCLYGALSLSAVVGGYKILRYFLNKRRDKAVEIRDEALLEILNIADKERSRFDMVIGNVKPIPCALRSFDATSMLLEAPSFINLSKKFIGRDVRCFFKVRTTATGKKAGDQFFFFTAPILDVEALPNEIKIVSLALPNILNTGQKREYFRYSPPRAYVIELAAWPENYESEKPSRLPQPQCLLTGEGDFKGYIVNLSAGGLMLEVDRMYVVHSGLSLDVGKGWLLRLTLLGMNNDLLRVWFVARLVNVLDTGVGKFQLAFRFAKYAWRSEDLPKLEWRPLSPDGVPPIASWILKRSVEQRPQNS